MVSALLAGGSALAHPNGALLAVILAIMLASRAIYRGGWQTVLGYVTGGVVTVVIFVVGWSMLRDQSFFEFVSWLLHSRRLSVTNTSVPAAFWSNLTSFVSGYSLGLKRLYILIFEVGVLVVGVSRYRTDRLSSLLSAIGLLWFMLALALLTPFFRWAFCIVLLFSLIVTGRLLSSAVARSVVFGLKPIQIFTALYALNTLAGSAYAVRLHASNTPYSHVAKTIDEIVPDGVPVVTHLEFWFALQHNAIYTSFTRWPTTSYAGLPQFLQSSDVRYAVLTTVLTGEASPTTGEDDVPQDRKHSGHFYKIVRDHVAATGRRVAVVRANAYGNIEIWQCRATGS
jgi:hypothetical protein